MNSIAFRAVSECPNYRTIATHIGVHVLEVNNAVKCIDLGCPFGAAELRSWAELTWHSVQALEASPNPARFQREGQKFADFLEKIEKLAAFAA